ncbi:NUDIX domain-containing protein [Rhodoplanes sp. TEM]|uniref:NUDIX domain-containing protein n=1 Tax=Rhodoplanes tepidamans TaxID=200616 RepID=A0ABT5JI06_RHOTP|nr:MULTISPECIES: NUDIX domain-containing protein [Rhodoplanes]MDC7789345.1 NUDIX domain-containing protein [Rhodoplanes tepidamans]MDC7986034.1 NUDIX domain-containing protein [Rhodoplanes sp. TEM]MDQ0358976.1 8-oxo-dGTP diphosphatase [Rhodoplanes tepidamans]
MVRKHIVAAGGIVVRDGPRPLIAIVQRRKDRRWVLPKGKLAADETPIAGARREVIEETGHDVVVHEFLGVITYPTRSAFKVAQFWRMQPREAPLRPLMRDIRAVDWLPLDDAVATLALPWEQAFLDGIGAHATKAAQPAPAAAAIAPDDPLSGRDPAASAASPLAPAAAPEDPGLLQRLWRGWLAPRRA